VSQSRFSIVLVGVSALLRRPLVSRLRPADGERSSWVVFAARGCRFDSGFRSVSWFFRWAGWPSGSLLRRLPLGGLALSPSVSEWPLGEFVLPPSASEIALGGLAFGLTASAFRHAPLRSCRSAGWFFRWAGWPSGSLLPLFGTRRFGDCPRRVGFSARRVGLRTHCFRFSARTASEWPLGELAFGLTASAFRRAPLRKLPSAGWFFRWAGWSSGSFLPLFGPHRFGVATGRVRSSAFRFGDSARRVGLRAHGFRFSACAVSEWLLGEFVLPPSALEIALGGLILPLGGLAFGLTASAFRHAALRRFRSTDWPSGSRLPLFGMHRFGVAVRRVDSSARWLAFGLTASAFRHAPIRRLPLGGLAFGLTASAFRHAPFRSGRWASWPSGSLLPLFGMRRSAPPRRRSEDRRSTPTRHLFHFKTLIPTC